MATFRCPVCLKDCDDLFGIIRKNEAAIRDSLRHAGNDRYSTTLLGACASETAQSLRCTLGVCGEPLPEPDFEPAVSITIDVPAKDSP